MKYEVAEVAARQTTTRKVHDFVGTNTILCGLLAPIERTIKKIKPEIIPIIYFYLHVIS